MLPVLQIYQATLKKGRLHGAGKVGTLLFPGYSSERAIVIFMRCEVGTFAAAATSPLRTHASALYISARAGVGAVEVACYWPAQVPDNRGTL